MTSDRVERNSSSNRESVPGGRVVFWQVSLRMMSVLAKARRRLKFKMTVQCFDLLYARRERIKWGKNDGVIRANNMKTVVVRYWLHDASMADCFTEACRCRQPRIHFWCVTTRLESMLVPRAIFFFISFLFPFSRRQTNQIEEFDGCCFINRHTPTDFWIFLVQYWFFVLYQLASLFFFVWWLKSEGLNNASFV